LTESSPSPTAEALFDTWLRRRAQGEELPLEVLCAEQPDLAEPLRRLHAHWLARSEPAGISPARPAGSGASGGSLEQRLKQRFGPEVELSVSLEHSQRGAEESVSSTRLVRRLAEHSAEHTRYALKGELARGGMGAVLKVWDEDLRRNLAMKVLLPSATQNARHPEGGPRRLARFLEEAQITGQLEHPGIVPVHELGLDSEGQVFFTMKLVRGRTLKQIFLQVQEGAEGWNLTRALGVVLKVCEAVAYAHAKRVIHRDLKPANVMIGNFGEVYVMDWGLARVLGRKDAHELRIERPDTTAHSVHTDRREEREGTPDSPLLTLGGDVVGTPAYMPPEQARGQVESLGPASDVYSIGAMLYHLLTGQVPYVPPGARISSRTVLLRVIEGPPRPIHELRRDVPPELEAICDKAMARDPARRYASTLDLAEDLRAYLEHRVVQAYETGALAEGRKWIARNRALASACAAALLALVAGLVLSSVLYVRARDSAALAFEQERVAQDSAEQAHASELRAQEGERQARNYLAQVLRLSALQDLDELTEEADRLWPAHPENEKALRRWLERARQLTAELPEHRATLAQLDPAENPWWHQQLSRLVGGLEALADPRVGLISAEFAGEHGWGVERRLERARALEEASRSGPEAARAWEQARASLGDPLQTPAYGGLDLAPQIGLLPLGRDPDSGLWEFAHLETGTPARRGDDGRLVLGEENGLVLVLIPGGRFWMGAQARDPAGRNYDPQATEEESPVHEVTLAPFFLSKYEMTQAQWQRATGANPSFSAPGIRGRAGSLLHPVEQVTWPQCDVVTRRLGLRLPDEEQWEYAARAEASTPWWTGAERESLFGAVNLLDASARGGRGVARFEEWLEDGFLATAPVGSYQPNPFGLCDVHGNVCEWCAGAYGAYGAPTPPGEARRVMRGGSFAMLADGCRSSIRIDSTPDVAAYDLGLRPARMLDPN